MSQKQLAGEDAQQSVAAIRALTQELEALLQPEQEEAAPTPADQNARGSEASGAAPALGAEPSAVLLPKASGQGRPPAASGVASLAWQQHPAPFS